MRNESLRIDKNEDGADYIRRLCPIEATSDEDTGTVFEGIYHRSRTVMMPSSKLLDLVLKPIKNDPTGAITYKPLDVSSGVRSVNYTDRDGEYTGSYDGKGFANLRKTPMKVAILLARQFHVKPGTFKTIGDKDYITAINSTPYRYQVEVQLDVERAHEYFTLVIP